MYPNESPPHPGSEPAVASAGALPALILLGGDALVAASFSNLPPHSVVIAADSGIDQAHRLGLDVDVAIGDFDSVTAEGLDRAISDGAEVRRHPVAKDATDFELALDAAQGLGATEITVLGGEGGRLDHLIANALVMASPRFRSVALTALGSNGERIHVVRTRLRLRGEPGEIVSLLAVNGPATGVRTDGLRFPLEGERLDPGSSRGVSNRMVATEAEVSLDSGVLLAVLPGPTHIPNPGEAP